MPQYSCWTRQHNTPRLIPNHFARLKPRHYRFARSRAVRLKRNAQATRRARSVITLRVAISYTTSRQTPLRRSCRITPNRHRHHNKRGTRSNAKYQNSATSQWSPASHIHPAAGHRYALIEAPSFPHGETIFHAYPRLSVIPRRCASNEFASEELQ